MGGPGSGGHRGKEKTERNKEIRRLRSEGKTLDEIGIVFRISKERVHQITGPAPLICRGLDRIETQDKIMEFYRQGFSDRQIAVEMGIKNSAIYRWREKRGLPYNRSKHARREYPERMLMYESGCSDTEIARVQGVSTNTICLWRKRRGLPSNYKGNRRIDNVRK